MSMKKFLITVSPWVLVFLITMYVVYGIVGVAVMTGFFVLFAIVFYLFYKWVEFINDKFKD